jgi:hypothetical protein
MKKMVLRASLLFLIMMISLVWSATASAATSFTFDDIDNWVGEGSNQAALVIDWNDSRSDALVWGFRWNGTATGEDMMTAIAGLSNVGSSNGLGDLGVINGQDARLQANLTSWSTFGGDKTVYGLGYDLDNDGFSYVAGDNETGHAADGDDVYSEGWMKGFWSYWVEDDAANVIGNNTSLSNWGLSARTLSNNSVDLWGWDADLDAFFGNGDGINVPVYPFQAADASPVPLPAAVWLLGGGLAGLMGFRQRRRK